LYYLVIDIIIKFIGGEKVNISKPAIEGGEPIRQTPLRFGVPFIEQEEIDSVVEVLKSGWITTGPKTQEFEEKFKHYVGAKHAIAVSSCTDAMELSLVVAGVGKDDEVITSPMTFSSTANVIVHRGAKPVFVDIEKGTLNIDPTLIEKHLTPKTKAIMPVHYAGQPCEMDEIEDIGRLYGLTVIDDAAHATGAEYHGKKIGSISDTTTFSFHVQKVMTTAEGGMITTESDDWAKKMRILRLHGMTKDAWARASDSQVHYDVVYPGYKCNMTDIQSAMGIVQLGKLESFISTRQKYAKIYDSAFQQMPEISMVKRIDDIRHAETMYVILLNLETLRIHRDEFVRCLQAENIHCAVHFKPVHLHSYYRETFGYRLGDYPNAEHAFSRVMSLPFSPKLTEDDICDVINSVKKVATYYRK
jgi:dTDP-4-amino-4,6-dideoxygalactose transaminase